jgi:hypothetical protein
MTACLDALLGAGANVRALTVGETAGPVADAFRSLTPILAMPVQADADVDGVAAVFGRLALDT